MNILFELLFWQSWNCHFNCIRNTLSSKNWRKKEHSSSVFIFLISEEIRNLWHVTFKSVQKSPPPLDNQPERVEMIISDSLIFEVIVMLGEIDEIRRCYRWFVFNNPKLVSWSDHEFCVENLNSDSQFPIEKVLNKKYLTSLTYSRCWTAFSIDDEAHIFPRS